MGVRYSACASTSQSPLERSALAQSLPSRRCSSLGIEMQRQWSDRATRRSTPLLFGFSSLVALFGQVLYPDGCISVARAGLILQADCHLTFHACRHQTTSVGFWTFPTSPTDPDMVFVPRSTLERLSWAVCSSFEMDQVELRCSCLYQGCRCARHGSYMSCHEALSR